MRPEITGELEGKVKAAADEAGYSHYSEFVRDAVRRRAEEVLDHE